MDLAPWRHWRDGGIPARQTTNRALPQCTRQRARALSRSVFRAPFARVRRPLSRGYNGPDFQPILTRWAQHVGRLALEAACEKPIRALKSAGVSRPQEWLARGNDHGVFRCRAIAAAIGLGARRCRHRTCGRLRVRWPSCRPRRGALGPRRLANTLRHAAGRTAPCAATCPPNAETAARAMAAAPSAGAIGRSNRPTSKIAMIFPLANHSQGRLTPALFTARIGFAQAACRASLPTW